MLAEPALNQTVEFGESVVVGSADVGPDDPAVGVEQHQRGEGLHFKLRADRTAWTAGDELLGLVRGLLCAGAQSLLVTLWDVDDTSTAKLMELFYRLFPRCGTAQALRSAMFQIREEYPHPYYWAPFALVGKTIYE